MKNILIILLIGFSTGTAHATDWVSTFKTDPLSGDYVPAHEISSYGNYIYHSPSKYDLIYWPLTDENWICMNPSNGYAAFNNHFEKVSEEDKVTLDYWLTRNYNPDQAPTTLVDKLGWLEQVYRQRKMGDDFWSQFYRLMAYIHREDREKSLGYVKKALRLLKKKLKTDPQGIKRIEVLYLIGEYNRRLGNLKKQQQYFDQVKKSTYTDEKGREQTGHPYFMGLIEDRENEQTDETPAAVAK